MRSAKPKRRRFLEPREDECKHGTEAYRKGEEFSAHREKTLSKLAKQSRELKHRNKWKHIYWTPGSKRSWNAKFYNEELCCRQMSAYFMKHFDRFAATSYHRVLGSKEAIDRTDLPANRYDKERVAYRGDRYMFSSIEKNGLGKCLQLVCQDMKLGEAKRFMLDSENHAMAVVVVYEAPEKYVVHFYDPNSTKSHQMAECRDMNEVKSLRLSHFLSDLTIHRTYFPVLKSMVVAFYSNPYELRPCDDSGVLEPVESYGNNLGEFLQYALMYELKDSVIAAVQLILDKHESILSMDKKAEMLLGLDKRRVAALNGAIFEGHVSAPIAFCRLVLECDQKKLSLTAKKHLLFRVNKDNMLPLNNAIYKNNTAFMRAFIKLVLETNTQNLPRAYKKAFVLARHGGVPAIHQAMKKGNTEMAIVYAKAIVAAKHSSIGSRSKRYLLEAKDASGKTAIDVAIDNGYIDTARAYQKLIAAYVKSERPELQIKPQVAPKVNFDDEDVGGFHFPACVIS
ncbi:MAG: ShET2/EspL2 family type III secretion system effector toxin [Coxiellaceae bacterium]|nr:ShET2/EspL2 family type III secretion system effector toxin [Coxiellaceae bacterium]